MPNALVTGGNSGIGKATAVALAAAGFDVGLTWHDDEDGAREACGEIEDKDRRAATRRLDLAEDPQAGPGVVDELAGELGGLDVFVNNAGAGHSTPFLDVDLDTWRQVLDI